MEVFKMENGVSKKVEIKLDEGADIKKEDLDLAKMGISEQDVIGNDEGISVEPLSAEEESEVVGGVSMVSDPIYRLNDTEVKALSRSYTLKKTGSGNYRILLKNSNQAASPSDINTLCNFVNEYEKSHKNTGKTFWDWLMS